MYIHCIIDVNIINLIVSNFVELKCRVGKKCNVYVSCSVWGRTQEQYMKKQNEKKKKNNNKKRNRTIIGYYWVFYTKCVKRKSLTGGN